MNLHSDTKAPPSPTLEKQKLSYWRKLGGGSLGISLGIHALILAAGVYFVVQVIPKEEKQPELVIPRTDGPGKPPTSVRPQTSTSPSDLPRIVNKGRSDITLPEPSPSDAMPNLNPISNGPMETNKGSGGFISGAYGPESPAIGGPETGKSPFGIPNAKADGITGVFYDLKQTKNGKPTGLNDIQAQEVIREFVTKGWKDHTFADFYQAPERLKQTRIFIPMMNAAKAPEAFHCEIRVPLTGNGGRRRGRCNSGGPGYRDNNGDVSLRRCRARRRQHRSTRRCQSKRPAAPRPRARRRPHRWRCP